MPVGASVSCDSINMNNILLVNICLLAVTALVCPFQVPQNYGGDSLNAAATPPRRVSVTQSRSNFWSSTVTRERRDAERKGGPLRNSLYVFAFKSDECKLSLIISCLPTFLSRNFQQHVL